MTQCKSCCDGHGHRSRAGEVLEKLTDVLSGIPLTILSGIFLAAGLALLLTDTDPPIDPAWGAILISGSPVIYSAVRRLLFEEGLRRISAPMLISVAMVASVLIGEVFAAGEVAFIMAVGEILEDVTTSRANRGIEGLMKLTPVQGRRITSDENGTKEEMVPAETIAEGDIIRILPGETVPADGIAVSGRTSVDQSVITGESIPADKAAGDSVFCGTLNLFGSVDIKVTGAGEDSSLNKLIRMVREAEENKAPSQRTADVWASRLIPLALSIAILTYLATGEIMRAVTVLVVFCPCALVLATPTSIMAAVGQATKHGVLIRSGGALEAMGRIDHAAFDKTGTLTIGKLRVSDIIAFTGTSETEILKAAASAESRSEHPFAKAITACASERNIRPADPESFEMSAGKGIKAVIGGRTVLCGNGRYTEENGAVLSEDAKNIVNTMREEGKAAVLVSEDGKCIGAIALSDTVRSNAADVVKELIGSGISVSLLTGDDIRAARYFAKAAGISDIRAELLPEQKAEQIRELQRSGKVCMVGDGVNDAPALKTADVGVAMGTIGSGIAIDSADITLMGDDISCISYLKRLSRAAMGTIRANIALSLAINFAAIIFSVLGFLDPVTGALIHNGGSILVILNAAALYDRKFMTDDANKDNLMA